MHLLFSYFLCCNSSYISPFCPPFLSLSDTPASFSCHQAIPRSVSPLLAYPSLSHQHPGADECMASYWSRWVMDDGWEMSDGVQAKVPIRGQPEGGLSPTGANGRRLEPTATVLTARPLLLDGSPFACFVSALLLCIWFPHDCGSCPCGMRCVFVCVFHPVVWLRKVAERVFMYIGPVEGNRR